MGWLSLILNLAIYIKKLINKKVIISLFKLLLWNKLINFQKY